MLKRKTPLRAKKPLNRAVAGLVSKMPALKRASSLDKPKERKKRKPLRAKPTGQLKVFREIWEEREHVSEVSGAPLVDLPDNPKEEPEQMTAWVRQFSHLLPKGSYRRYRLDKRNIVLKTAEEHDLWHELGPEELMFSPGWAEVCDRYFELKREANGVTNEKRSDEHQDRMDPAPGHQGRDMEPDNGL